MPFDASSLGRYIVRESARKEFSIGMDGCGRDVASFSLSVHIERY